MHQEDHHHLTVIMHQFLLLTVVLASVKSQDLTSIRTKHPEQFQTYNSYYSSGYHPNTKFKPGVAYKAIPPKYRPSDICFNPNYYGFLNTAEGIFQTCPTPQPNIYYVPNGNTQSPLPPAAYLAPVWPPYQYSPWAWYVGNPASPIHQRNSTAEQNETTTTPKSIRITKPTIKVKIMPPTFDENVTSITNTEPEQPKQKTRLSEKNRKMIKRLLKMGSKYLHGKKIY